MTDDTSPSQSLISLTAEYQKLIHMLMESGGEISAELEEALTVSQETLAKKTDKYDFVITKLEAEEEYWKARAEQYTRVARACANARARLRDAIKGAMQAMGKTEIVGENATFKLTNSAPKLVLNEKELPKDFVIETIVATPDKEKIKETLKAGGVIAGAYFEPVQALRIGISRKVK